EKGLRPGTLRTYSDDLKQIRAYFGDHKKLQNIDSQQATLFLESDELLLLQQGGHRAQRTIDKTVRVLRMFLFWAHENGLITEVTWPEGVPLGRSTLVG